MPLIIIELHSQDAKTSDNYEPDVSMENEESSGRLSKMEYSVYCETYTNETFAQRVKRLVKEFTLPHQREGDILTVLEAIIGVDC